MKHERYIINEEEIELLDRYEGTMAQGKPTLAPESDKRPAMNTAKNDFMEEKHYE